MLGMVETSRTGIFASEKWMPALIHHGPVSNAMRCSLAHSYGWPSFCGWQAK